VRAQASRCLHRMRGGTKRAPRSCVRRRRTLALMHCDTHRRLALPYPPGLSPRPQAVRYTTKAMACLTLFTLAGLIKSATARVCWCGCAMGGVVGG
jgi:hypothetical protein